jgi:hypothetical protein
MKGKRVVLAHAGLESWVNRLGKPAFILHSDQAAFKHPFVDRAAKGIGRANIHIAAETAAADLLNMHYTMPKRLKTIHGLPIKAPVPSSGASPFRNPGKVNITVSGGALGLNTPQMAERILNDSKIAKGTVIHAVAGRGQNLAALEALEATTKGKSVQVRAYGFAPLRDMMDAADVNVLRPHGTSITEARAAKKPFLLFLPHEKGRRMDWRNIKAVESLYTTPLSVSEHTVGKRVTEVLSNYRLELSRAQTLGVAPTGGSKGAARIIAKTPYFTAFPRTGRWLGAGRLGLGGLAAGAVGALAYRHAANRGLVLQRSKSNPQVQRWQRVVK